MIAKDADQKQIQSEQDIDPNNDKIRKKKSISQYMIVTDVQ